LSLKIDHIPVVVFHDDLPRHAVWTMRLTADVRLTHAAVLLVRRKDLAVAAARRAFEGPWSKFKPYERQQVLFKLAQEIRVL
jgi:acyl-CoA reductase-like NAD-dependent aldehyde dehydrogenase